MLRAAVSAGTVGRKRANHRTWSVVRGLHGDAALVVYELDGRGLLWKMAGTAWFGMCDVTGGCIGGHGLGTWAWRIPLSRARDLDGQPARSLAGSLFDVESWLARKATERSTRIARFPVDDHVAGRVTSQSDFHDVVADLDGELRSVRMTYAS
jgi:hypothetical protein